MPLVAAIWYEDALISCLLCFRHKAKRYKKTYPVTARSDLNMQSTVSLQCNW